MRDSNPCNSCIQGDLQSKGLYSNDEDKEEEEKAGNTASDTDDYDIEKIWWRLAEEGHVWAARRRDHDYSCGEPEFTLPQHDAFYSKKYLPVVENLCSWGNDVWKGRDRGTMSIFGLKTWIVII